MTDMFWNPNAEPTTDPIGELLQLSGSAREFMHKVGEMLTQVQDYCVFCGRGDVDPALINVLQRAMNASHKILVDLEKLDLKNRQLRLDQVKVAMVAVALSRAFDKVLPDLNERQKIDIRDEIVHVLAELEGNPPEPETVVNW